MTKKTDVSTVPETAAGAPKALIAAASIPAVPKGTQALEGSAKQALLKVYADQRAEVDQAMEQLWSHRDELARDLGTLCPNPEAGRALHQQLTEARASNAKAQALASYTDDQEALASHAVMSFLNEAVSDIEHMAKKDPQIAARYDKVLAVSAQRREAIVAGIARKKAEKADAPKG